MVFERIKFLASDVAPKPEETTYWVDIWSNPYGGVIKYYNGEDWVKLDLLTVAEDYRRLRFKPTLNGVTIEDNKTSADYKIPSKEEVDNVLNDFELELNTIVNKANQVIIDLNQHIITADADFTKIKTDITNIKESLLLIIGPSASQVIDKFNELISFLEGYNDDAKLKTILTALENKLTALILNVETDVDLLKKEIMAALNEHKNNTFNPHNVTKDQVGLDNVDNTSDLNKPISKATQQAITNEATTRGNKDKELEASITVNTNDLSKVKQQLNTIQSTVDRFDDTYIPLSLKGTANGVAPLNENGIVPPNMLPAFNDEVVECFATFTKNPDGSLTDIRLYEDEQHQREIQGEASKIYLDITVRTLYNRAVNNENTPSEITENVLSNYQVSNTQLFSNMSKGTEQTVFGNYQFRWTGTQFAVINASTVIGELTGTAFDGGRGKALEDLVNKINGTNTTEGSFRKADKDLETTLNNKIATDINTAKTQIQSGNVATATKLQTPVSLWGNQFDGSASISGNIIKSDGDLTIRGKSKISLYNGSHALDYDAFSFCPTVSNTVDLGKNTLFFGISFLERVVVGNNSEVCGGICSKNSDTVVYANGDYVTNDNHSLILRNNSARETDSEIRLYPDKIQINKRCDSKGFNISKTSLDSSDDCNIYKSGEEFIIGTKGEYNISLSYNNGLKQVYLTSVDFRPAVASNGKIDLGSNEAKWKNLYLSGNAKAALGFYEESDECLKTNIKPIEQKGNIELVEFDWKESGKHSYGVIAQLIEKDYPELVDSTGNYKTVKYDSVLVVKCALLENKIKELETKLEELINGKDSN